MGSCDRFALAFGESFVFVLLLLPATAILLVVGGLSKPLTSLSGRSGARQLSVLHLATGCPIGLMPPIAAPSRTSAKIAARCMFIIAVLHQGRIRATALPRLGQMAPKM